MNIKGFSEVQSQALIDLLVLGMYADHNLASAEEACVQRLLDRFEFASDYDRKNYSDAAFTRVSRHTNSTEAMREYATRLAGSFATAHDRRCAYDLLDDLLESDGRVTNEESKLLAVVKEAFQIY